MTFNLLVAMKAPRRIFRALWQLIAFWSLVSGGMAAELRGELQRQFIWRGGEQTQTAEFAVFRKSFVAPARDNAWLHIFSDARYVLWINGRYVERGPGRFDPVAPEFDSIDCASFLKPGSNSIVVLVMSYPPGERGTNGKMKRHAPGLTAQLEIGGGATLTKVRTDVTWKWRTNLRYQLPDVRWGFVNDGVDLRRDDGDWTQPDYDDTSWSNAVAISGAGWGLLRPRFLPLLREQEVAVQGPVFPVELRGSNVVYFALPRMVQGFFEVDAESATGGSLQIKVSERGSLTNIGDTHGSVFKFTMGAGRQKVFTSDTMGFRYLKVSGTGGAVTLRGLRVVDRRYPYEDAGEFVSSDAWLNDLWQRAVHTVRVCSDDGYMDCGLREKAEWMGDAAVVAYPVSRVTLAGPAKPGEALRSDAGLMKSMIRHVAQSGSQYGDGRLKAHVPSDRLDIHAYIEDYSCLWVQTLREVYEHTGDAELVREVWSALTGQMKWFLDRRSSRGLLVGREFVIFDNPLKYVTCEGATLNAFLYRALLDAAVLGDVIGKTNQATIYRAAAAQLQASFNQHLWDATRGSYFGGLDTNGNVVTNDDKGRPLKETVTGHAAMLALDRGIVPPERLESVRKFFLATYNSAVGMPYTAFWALEQLYRLDDPARDAEALKYIRSKWADVMKRTDTGTLTEAFNGGAACHNFGASCAYFLSGYILGVRLDGPARDGKLLIEPRGSGLASARGKVVTELGVVPVTWSQTNGQWQLHCTVPDGAAATLRLPRPETGARALVRLNAAVVPNPLAQGRYFVVTVGPGTHEFTVGSAERQPAK
jgi:alpha-L-rhamnosidase